jgi:hypothetical protein
MRFSVTSSRVALFGVVAAGAAAAAYFIKSRRCAPQPTEDAPAAAREPSVVSVADLGLVIRDDEFAEWHLESRDVCYDVCDDYSEQSPYAVVQYVLERDASRPQIGFIVEDLMMSSSASEYVERSIQQMSSANLQSGGDLRNQLDAPTEADLVCCAFDEIKCDGEKEMRRSIFNVVAVKDGLAVIIQMICKENSKEHHGVFIRVCNMALAQLHGPRSIISDRLHNNLLEIGLPSVRSGVPGCMITLPVGRTQLLSSSTNPSCEKLRETWEKISTTGKKVIVVAFVEKRTPESGSETVEIFVSQFESKTGYDRAVELGTRQLDFDRPCSVCWRRDLLCCVVVIAGSDALASNQARTLASELRHYTQQRRVLQYCHRSSGISYSVAGTNATPSFLTHFFGPYHFEIFPLGQPSTTTSLRIAVEPCLGNFGELQKLALRQYSSLVSTRRPRIDGWFWVDYQAVGPRGPITEHVTMLEHQGFFIHLVWTVPRGNRGPHDIADEVRRNLHLP